MYWQKSGDFIPRKTLLKNTALIPVFQLLHCTDGISVIWLHSGTPDTSDGTCSPTMPLAPGCQGGIPFSLLLQLPPLAPVGKHATREKSASPVFCFCCTAWVSLWLSDRFYKIPAVPGGKWIDLTAWSRRNFQKRIHFRMIQTPFTTSSKQLFTNCSIGSCVSGWRNRRKCVYCVFHTEINREKMLIKWLLGSQNVLSFARRCCCHTRRSWGKSSWLTSASALAEIKVVEQKLNSSWWNSVFMASSVIVFVILFKTFWNLMWSILPLKQNL